MKKILAVMMTLIMAVSMVACGGDMGQKPKEKPGQEAPKDKEKKPGENEKKPGENEKKPGENEKKPAYDKMSKMIKDITKGVKVPSSDTFDLDKNNFEDYSFVKWQEGIKAAVSEGQVLTSAHSLVLVKTKSGEAEKMAKEIAANADVRKWICVQAEVGKVLYTDEYVFLVMTYKDNFDGLKSNFEKLVGAGKVKVVDVKSAGK